MIAAIQALENTIDNDDSRNLKDENFSKFYEAIFIDPSKLTPY